MENPSLMRTGVFSFPHGGKPPFFGTCHATYVSRWSIWLTRASLSAWRRWTRNDAKNAKVGNMFDNSILYLLQDDSIHLDNLDIFRQYVYYICNIIVLIIWVMIPDGWILFKSVDTTNLFVYHLFLSDHQSHIEKHVDCWIIRHRIGFAGGFKWAVSLVWFSSSSMTISGDYTPQMHNIEITNHNVPPQRTSQELRKK